MAYFSEADINEAKKRVRDMQSRADYYSADAQNSQNRSDSHTKSTQNNASPNAFDNTEKSEKQNNEKTDENPLSLFSDIFNGGDSSRLIILILILVLSREGADNILILALLYLLL